jgi:DNA polymerase
MIKKKPLVAERRQILERLEKKVSKCTNCPLHENRTCTVPGYYSMAKFPKVLLVGEGPGEQEDISGEPFVGRAGQVLNIVLKRHGINRADLGIVNVVKCRPPNNRNPSEEEVAICSKYLKTQIECLRPIMIMPMGVVAAETILKRKIKITKERGKFSVFKLAKDKLCAVLPTIHPSAVLHNPNWRRHLEEDLLEVAKLTAIHRLLQQRKTLKEEIPWLPILKEEPSTP